MVLEALGMHGLECLGRKLLCSLCVKRRPSGMPPPEQQDPAKKSNLQGKSCSWVWVHFHSHSLTTGYAFGTADSTVLSSHCRKDTKTKREQKHPLLTASTSSENTTVAEGKGTKHNSESREWGTCR